MYQKRVVQIQLTSTLLLRKIYAQFGFICSIDFKEKREKYKELAYTDESDAVTADDDGQVILNP